MYTFVSCFGFCFQDSFMLQQASLLRSFLWLNNIPLYMYSIFCLSVHPLIDICVASICCCKWCCYEHSCTGILLSSCFPFSCLDMCLGVGLLGQTVILCLAFRGICSLFCMKLQQKLVIISENYPAYDHDQVYTCGCCTHDD